MKKMIALLLLLLCTGAQAQRRDVKLPEQPKRTNYKGYINENAGFWAAIEAEGGSSIMAHRKNMQYAQATATAGYRISEFLRFGAGLGVRAYVNNAEARSSDCKFCMPIYANLRGNFISAYDRDGVPFWSVNVGGITSEGFFLSPTLGYSFGGLRNNFLLGISYTLSSLKDSHSERTLYSYFGLKLGYEF